MACPDFDELVRQGPGGHAAYCEDCRALLDAWAEVDDAFETAFAGVAAPPTVAPAVRARIAREIPVRRPSILPEALDLIGWAAVLALIAIMLPHLLLRFGAALAGAG
jgi:predicted anti-sigma-YlaC factor YlaD